MPTLVKNRFPVLDGLRAISILLVLATHMLPLGPKFLQLNSTTGPMGMSLFFGLSGFLITRQLAHNDNVRDFLIRRLARIIPLAYAYAFVVFIIATYDPERFFGTLTFLGNYRVEYLNEYNSHFWSLCVEMHFYLIIAAVVAAVGRKGLWIVFPACLIITIFRINVGAYVNINTHLRVDEILAGACIALLYRDESPRLNSYLLTLVAVSIWAASSSPFSGWLQYVRPYASAFLIFLMLKQGPSHVSDFLACKPLRYIATISYALYVIHHGLINGWFNEGSVLERYLFKRPISFALTFALAHFSTFYWEKYWQEAAKSWISKRSMRERSVQPT